MSESKWYVGQTVVLRENDRDVVEVPVTRVARKYVYVTRYNREKRFNIETGLGDSQYGYGDQIYTQDEWADRQTRDSLLKALRDEGLYFSRGESLRSTATLQRLWDALQVEESGK
ncbi:hypothetical protein [Mycobacteroides chelonae]|uniref:beta barrel domain-containing protein n=1 Tax=Mycobacteroides chelonae TaxID=1774 RepID=UPI0008AA04FD|nr:hypothetical protein [Mycobacteroides chelonae]OHU64047.1 hypothetical protein BKG85_11505 [Mycobacteroides chelonae]